MQINPEAVKELRKIRDEVKSLVDDGRAWNAARTDAVPIDIGADLVLLDLCERGIRAAEACDTKEYSRLAGEIVVASARSVAAHAEYVQSQT